MRGDKNQPDESVVIPGPARARTFEQRHEPRESLTAAITAIDLRTGARIDARTNDISSAGCYVDSMNPFPAGSTLQIRITKDGQSFDIQAKVAYCLPGAGMGLVFMPVDSLQIHDVKKWLANIQDDLTVKIHNLELVNQVSAESDLKSDERLAFKELLVLLMRKGLLTVEEGEPIMRRILHSRLNT